MNITYEDYQLGQRLSARLHRPGRYLFTLDNHYLFLECPMKKYYRRMVITKTMQVFQLHKSSVPFQGGEQQALVSELMQQEEYRFVAPEPEDVIECLFRQLLPKEGLEVREEQITLSKTLYRDLLQRKNSLCEIPRGIGSRMAYLVACVAVRFDTKRQNGSGPVILCVPDVKNEAVSRITRKDLPLLSRVLLKNKIEQTPLCAMIKKGKEHFLCDNRLFQFLEFLSNSEKERDRVLLSVLQNLHLFQNSIDLDHYPELMRIAQKINVPKGCNAHCPNYRQCRYQTYRKRMQSPDCDFLICSHHDYIMDIRGKDRSLPPSSALLIEQAHLFFEDVQINVYRKEELEELLQGLSVFQPIPGLEPYLAQLASCGQLFDDFFTHSFPGVPKGKALPIGRLKEPLLLLLKKLYHIICELLGQIPVAEKDIRWLLQRSLRPLQGLLDGSSLWLIRDSDWNWTLYCKMPQKWVTNIWKTRKARILMDTAWTKEKGGFAYMEQKMGLDKLLPALVDKHTFSSRAYPQITVNQKVPRRSAENYSDVLIQELLKLLRNRTGKCIVYVKSYYHMIELYDVLLSYLPDCIYRMDQAEPEDVDGIYLTNRCEGEEVQQAAQFIFVTLPFPFLKRYCCKEDEEGRKTEMLLAVKRVIHTMKGGSVVILDERARRPYYKKIFEIERNENHG